MDQIWSIDPNAAFLHTDIQWLPYQRMDEQDHLFRDASFATFAAAFGFGRRIVQNVAARELRALHNAGTVFTISEWAREDLIAAGAPADRVYVARGGISDELLSDAPQPKSDRYSSGRTLVVCKTRFRQKGLDLLLDGFRIAREYNPNLSLDVVAPPEVVRPGHGVRVVSNLDFSALRQLMADCALYAMPARFEPFGLVYLEAQALGAPVLGSDRCAFPELAGFGEGGFILDSARLNAAGVAAALLNAHSDPARLAKMGKAAGRRVIRDWHWSVASEAILSRLRATSES